MRGAWNSIYLNMHQGCPVRSLCPALQLIYNFPEELFADAGVMAIEHADFDGIERLALVTGLSQNPASVTLTGV